jgi:hypothetical protein
LQTFFATRVNLALALPTSGYPHINVMNLELNEQQAVALIKELSDIVENSTYPFSLQSRLHCISSSNRLRHSSSFTVPPCPWRTRDHGGIVRTMNDATSEIVSPGLALDTFLL